MRANNRGRIALLAAVGFLVLPGVADENIKIEIRDVKVEDAVYTPCYQIQTEQDHEQGAAQKWIRLGVYFKTEGG